MKLYKYIYLALIAATLCACTSHRTVAEGDSRYRRAPIREVSQQQLDADTRLITALGLQESGHTDEALAAYAELAKAEPKYAAAWHQMSRLLLQRSWADSALACARRAAALQPDNRWYQIQLSDACIAAGDLEGAVAALNRVERIMGVNEAVSLQKQRLWTAAGKPDKAARELERLADAMPQDKHYNAILAEMYMSQKNYKKAKERYDRVLAADPDDEYIHIQLAEYHKALGHSAEADSEMVRAFRNPRLDASTKLQLLASFYTDEEFFGSHRQTTFRLMDMAMAQADDPRQYAAFYGNVLFRQQKYAEAAQWLETALTVDSSQYGVWELLLISLSSLKDRDAELANYAARAERLFPMQTLPHYVAALGLAQKEKHAEALAKLDAASRWGFNNGYLEAECTGLRAECLYRTGKYDECWKTFERYLQLHPDDWNMMNNYAWYMAEQGVELEKALEMSRRTIDAEPKNANSLDTYGWLLHLLGRDAEALPYLERALRLDTGNQTIRDHYNALKK